MLCHIVMAPLWCLQKAVNDNITQVWWFYDTHKMFN